MKVRLLFECVQKSESKGYGENPKLGTVRLAPVYHGNIKDDDALAEEAKAFYNATPSGSCEFGTINNAALEQFEVGQQFYLTIERRPSTAGSPATT